MREQVVNAISGVRLDTHEHIAQILKRVDPVGLARRGERIEASNVVSAVVGADVKIVLSPKSDSAKRGLTLVAIWVDTGILQEACKSSIRATRDSTSKRPAASNRRRSPDPHARGRCDKERLGGVYVERGIPRIEISHGQGAVVRRCVTVGHEPLALKRLAHLGLPSLREREKELLLSAEPSFHRRRGAVERCAPRVVSDREACEIGDVFAQGELTVDGRIGKGFVRAELRGERLARGLKMREIGRRPPVREPSLRVEFSALIVERMADLVADDVAHQAIIVGRGGARVEEWR